MPERLAGLTGVRAEHHAMISAGLGAGLGFVFHSVPMGVWAFLAGVFVDLDHVLDYHREYGPLRRPAHLLEVAYGKQLDHAVLILHGWELLPFLAAGCLWTGWPWLIGATAGWTLHMVFDQMTNARTAWTYFFVGRWKHGFDHDLAFKPEPPKGCRKYPCR